MRRLLPDAVSLAVVMLLAACGGSGDTGAPIVAASVLVSPTTASVEVGQSTTLSVTLRDGNGATLGGRPIAWSSDAVTVATVNGGVVTGVAPGTATIAATADGRTGTAVVTVTPIPVARVVLSDRTPTLVVGTTRTLTAQTLAASGASLANRAVSWSTTTPTIATVTGGVVTAVAVGTTTVIAASEGRTDTALVTVTPVPVASITLAAGASSLPVGGTTLLTTVARDAAGLVLTGRAVTYTSGATAVATVSSNVVTAVAPGTATITATCEGQSASVTLTVTLAPVASVSVSPSSTAADVGQTTTLSAIARDSSGGSLSGRPISWSSSNSGVATVVNGVVTGVAPGTVSISATVEGRTGTAAVTITRPPVTWVRSNELEQGTIDPALRLDNVAVASDGRALEAIGSSLYERSAAGSWNLTPVTQTGSPAVIRTYVDPTGQFWATGSNGVIWRRDASGWVNENTTTNAAAFNGISIHADQSGFAVGNPGNVLYHRSAGGVWTTRAISNSQILVGVMSVDASLAFAWGAPSSGASAVFQWNGAGWIAVTMPVANFRAQHGAMLSASEAYLVGTTGTDPLSNTRFTVLRWNGTSWNVIFQKPVEGYAGSDGLARCPDNSLYAASTWGNVYRIQGSSVTELAGGKPHFVAMTPFCESDNSLWLSRWSPDLLLLRYTAGAWTTMRWRPSVRTVALADNGVTIIGHTMGVAQRVGTTWTRVDVPFTPQAPVFFPSAVAATGSTAVRTGRPTGRFAGGAWQWDNSGTFANTSAAAPIDATTIFSVGNGTTVSIFNGTIWSSAPLPSGGPTSYSDIKSGGGFAVATNIGASPTAVQWNGSTWSVVPVNPPGGWFRYEVFSGNSMVNLANDGRLSAWNGTTWEVLPNSFVSSAFSVQQLLARSPTEVYLFQGSNILYYDGARVRTSQTAVGTINVVARNGADAIAAGNAGLVLRATLPSLVSSTPVRGAPLRAARGASPPSRQRAPSRG